MSVAVTFRMAAAIAIVSSMTSCFTGIESTPKITARDLKRQNITERSGNSVLSDIGGETPSSWKPGKQFFVTDERVKRALRQPESDSSQLAGKILTLSGVDTVPSLTGESRIELVFTGENGSVARYATGMTGNQWNTLGSYEVPFMIELDMIAKAKKRLTGNRYYFLASRRLDRDGKETEGPRYNPVTIVDVTTGDETRPLKVAFKDDVGNVYSVLMTLGNEPTSLRNFETMFAVENPRKNYPRITDEVWKLIQDSKVQLGMTPEECRLALGSPDNYRRIPTTAGMVEQWSFNNGSFLTFEDGVLARFRL